ncbi:DNA polymerase III subunit gamma/tau [Dictyobacter arantiisoli]|uniref:DNA polymerase III subunit gamma/tau n=1 Tax=Dictyobacter arantiisoli TaxID=2014874 RepID=A0A5A5TI26_9CHLR|nr:DNA polymerase III subunit gamma/tau [Dictyobacter arantiisoli]GCF10865.1 DNA polymerase III subunit gamma/tau [Dictyobacter arantiisoli]
MASQSLYRKWRSQTFGDLVGQESVITTLKNALSSGNLRHAYLFTGPRGTGKTSMARLLAKTINCTNSKNGEPCNVCAQCREITAGSSFNVLEIDAASNRGIDSIRELREKVMMPPTTGKYKVYILDEAHMLTTEAFNALLKTLEEPPDYAIFVLATTDVHKMLPTVLSRCQRFDFKRFTLRQLVDHLHFVSQQEQVTLQAGAAELIARAAAGGMRDALSLLDQAIAYCGVDISLEQVQTMLGVADPRAIQKIISHVADLESAEGLHLINTLSESGADLRQINGQIAEFWRAMMLAKAGANIAAILDNTDDEVNDILQVSKYFVLDELTECARQFALNELMQKSQSTPQLGLELAFLACIAIHRRAKDGPVALAHPATGSTYPTNVGNSSVPQNRTIPSTHLAPSESSTPSQAAYSAAPATEPRPASAVTASRSSAPQSQIHEGAAPRIETSQPGMTAHDVPATPAINQHTSIASYAGMPSAPAPTTGDPVSVSAEPPTLTIDTVQDKWEAIRRRVKTRKDGSKIAALLSGYTILGVEGTAQLPIIVGKAIADFHYKTLQNDEYNATIRWALKIELNIECDIRLLPPNAHFATSMTNRAASVASALPALPSQSEQPMAPGSVFPAVPPPSTPEPEQRPPDRPANSVVTPTVEKVTPAVSPLARNDAVSENMRVPSENRETRLEIIKKHAESNPVVSEVIRMFRAEIQDIQPK